MFVPLEETTLVFTMFLRRKHCFLRCFSTRGLKCIVNTSVFFTSIISSSQSKPAKNTGICTVLRRQNVKKHDVWKQFFTFFQLVLLNSKINHFLLFCHHSSGLKIVLNCKRNAKLHLNSTFCLSHSLQQSSRAKSWGRLSGPKNAVNFFLDVPCILPAKKVAPPAKADLLLVPPERHAPLHLPVRADFLLNATNTKF